MRFGGREAAGAVADLGVLLPIAVALIVANGLSATAVLLPAGCFYVAVVLVLALVLVLVLALVLALGWVLA